MVLAIALRRLQLGISTSAIVVDRINSTRFTDSVTFRPFRTSLALPERFLAGAQGTSGLSGLRLAAGPTLD